jgi:hypothetical protein
MALADTVHIHHFGIKAIDSEKWNRKKDLRRADLFLGGQRAGMPGKFV